MLYITTIKLFINQKLTLRALFLSLFMTENCLSLAFTVSPKETFGAFLAFCIHGWSDIILKKQTRFRHIKQIPDIYEPLIWTKKYKFFRYLELLVQLVVTWGQDWASSWQGLLQCRIPWAKDPSWNLQRIEWLLVQHLVQFLQL